MSRCTLPAYNLRLTDGRLLLMDPDQSFDESQRRMALGYRGLARVYHTLERHDLLVIASMDCTPKWGDLLHVSMSYSKRYPTWAEIKDVKEAFYGAGIDAMMVLPAAQDYVNLHPNCFHLWETPETWELR